MPEDKGIGSKFLGLFVESGEGPEAAGASDQSAVDEIAELARQSGAAKAPAAAPPPPNLKLDGLPTPVAGSETDFDALFRQAGMDAAELDRVKKAEDLLKGLPESTPLPVKKQIVEASLKAFGFEIEKIVQAAQNQKRALDAYVRVNETQTAKSVTDSQAEIQALTQKIEKLRQEIEKKSQGLVAATQAAQGRKAQVQKVLDFFHAPAVPTP